jgi:SRSO17 transposase
MTPQQMAGLGPALAQFLRSFRSCFSECRLLDHFGTYCRGLLSDLPRKSVEPMALAAGGTVRALQVFLSHGDWDHARLRDQLQQRVAQGHAPAPGQGRGAADPGAIGLIDETSVPKKGDKTPGVQRQYCGASGKIDNGVVSVHLGYSFRGLQTLLDSDLYLPTSWDQDRDRCREAGIPDDVVYRPKTAIALDQVRHALGNGLRFDWLVFDEGYGKEPDFLLGLDALGQTWIGEVPKSFRCWPSLPAYHSLRKEFASKEVYNVARWSPAFIYQDWQSLLLPRQTVEPTTWDIKAAQVHLRDATTDRPTDRTYWLIVGWNRATDEHKYWLSNAPVATSLHTLLKAAFRRADIEHLLRVAKSEVGLGHFEGRQYRGLLRHLILCQCVLLFLAQQTQRLNAQSATPSPATPLRRRGKKAPGPRPAPHPGTDCPGLELPVPTLA